MNNSLKKHQESAYQLKGIITIHAIEKQSCVQSLLSMPKLWQVYEHAQTYTANDQSQIWTKATKA